MTTLIQWAPDSSYCTAVGVEHLKTFYNPTIKQKNASAPMSKLMKLRKAGFSSIAFGSSGKSYAAGYDGKIHTFQGA